MWIKHPNYPDLMINTDTIVAIQGNMAYFPTIGILGEKSSVPLTEAQLKQIGASGAISSQKRLGVDGMPTEAFFERLYQTGVFSMPKFTNGNINKTTFDGIAVADTFRKSRKAFIREHKLLVYDPNVLSVGEDELSWDQLCDLIVDTLVPKLLEMESKGKSFRLISGKLGKFGLRDFFIRDHVKGKPTSPAMQILYSSIITNQSDPVEKAKKGIPEECRPYVENWVKWNREKHGKWFEGKHELWLWLDATKLLTWYESNRERLMEYAEKTQFYKKMFASRAATPKDFFRLIWIAGSDFYTHTRPGFIPHPTNFDDRWTKMTRVLRDSFDTEIGETSLIS